MNATTMLLKSVIESDQDFEWYPTTNRMIEVVAKHIPSCECESIMDIGAGDGRVLVTLHKLLSERKTSSGDIKLYGIEKSIVLVQAQPEEVIPVGTDFYQQNLACLPADYIFCNPPYSQYESWCTAIIESGYARKAFLVIPQRWKNSEQIETSLNRRKAKARVIHSDDFLDADRQARAVVDIVQITYPSDDSRYYGGREQAQDPFDAWFDQNFKTFDKPEDEPGADQFDKEIAKVHNMETIHGLVGAYDQEYTLMETNYQAIFKLDRSLLAELGVTKEAVREGIKKRMIGLKAKYWQLLFLQLKTLTDRLSTGTKEKFLKKLVGPTSIAFTEDNVYAVTLWAIKHANKYYDEQLIKLFKDLSCFETVLNYKSNQRTWLKSQWRFMDQDPSHYSLDYRIVVSKSYAIKPNDAHMSWDYPGDLAKHCHDLIADAIAVIGNLGFTTSTLTRPSLNRQWTSGEWQDFYDEAEDVLFQVKAHKNGNLHMRFKQDAIRALNVEAGRLLGWLKNANDVVEQLGYTPEEAEMFFDSTKKITPSNMKLLMAS